MNSWDKYLSRTNPVTGVPPNLFGYYLIDQADKKTYETINWKNLKNTVISGEFKKDLDRRFNSNSTIKEMISKYFKDAPIGDDKLMFSLDVSPITVIGSKETALTKRFNACGDITLDIVFYPNKADGGPGTRIAHISFHSPEPKLADNGECTPWPKDGSSFEAGTGGMHYVIHQLIRDNSPLQSVDKEPTIRFLPNINNDVLQFVENTATVADYEKNKAAIFSMTGKCKQIVQEYTQIAKSIEEKTEALRRLGYDKNTVADLMNTQYTKSDTQATNTLMGVLLLYIKSMNSKINTDRMTDKEEVIKAYTKFRKATNTIDNFLTANMYATEPGYSLDEILNKLNTSIKQFNDMTADFNKLDIQLKQKSADYESCVGLLNRNIKFIHNHYEPGSDGFLIHDFLYSCVAMSLNSFIPVFSQSSRPKVNTITIGGKKTKKMKKSKNIKKKSRNNHHTHKTALRKHTRAHKNKK